MTLSIPNYFMTVAIQDASLRYEWDDWRTLPVLDTPDEELVARLGKLSQRAVLAFECATAEWIVYRFDKLNDNSAPWQYLEAAWAMIVHRRYCGYGSSGWQYYAQKGWDGPVRRPIKNALDGLEIDFQQLFSEFHADPSTGAALLYALASYVISEPAPYKKWSQQVMQRFEALYPRVPEDQLGDVIPREAVDPEFEFHVEQSETLINRFLSSLDYRSNRFLSTPEGMRERFPTEEDFKGIPYVFDMEADRQARRDRTTGEHHH